ncbi:MAG: hypothetical protein ACRDQ2_05820, partial [Gaiellales bacterium]
FVVTAAALIVLFGWTFFTTPGRPAAADDPAYYSWRTEALLANDPEALLDIDGPLDMYSGGYRVATPVLAGLLRRIVGVASLTPTIILAVGLRVLIPLLLAGFAYRYRPDPLIWHSVALGVGSLLLTPPFGGYLDNVMTLFFLSASLYLIAPARTSWGPRIAFFLLLLVSGFTHPTTLAIFCLTLGLMAFARFVFRGFSLGGVISHDGAVLITALAAAASTFVLWRIGMWGVSASLSEAALPPPAGAGFFKTRLNDWLTAMNPAVNGPLFVIGAIGLVAAGRRAAADDLTRVAIAWLAPLIGIFGVFAGVAYPYYRFFNTTTAWLLVIGIGIFFVSRYSFDIAKRGGASVLALIGLVAVAAVIGTNFRSGFSNSGWNDPGDAWMKADEHRDLDALHLALTEDPPDGVVFVVDAAIEEPVRIYGFAKRAGNVSRYGVPAELQDRTAFYLGSVDDYLAGRASDRSDYHEELSQASLDDANAVAGRDAAVVIAEVFNEDADLGDIPGQDGRTLVVADSQVNGRSFIPSTATPGGFQWLGAVLAGLLMLIPGVLLLRWALPDAGLVDALGLVPALSAALLILVGMGMLGLGRSPLTSGRAWATLITTIVISLIALGSSFFARDKGLPRGSMNFPAVS